MSDSERNFLTGFSLKLGSILQMPYFTRRSKENDFGRELVPHELNLLALVVRDVADRNDVGGALSELQLLDRGLQEPFGILEVVGAVAAVVVNEVVVVRSRLLDRGQRRVCVETSGRPLVLWGRSAASESSSACVFSWVRCDELDASPRRGTPCSRRSSGDRRTRRPACRHPTPPQTCGRRPCSAECQASRYVGSYVGVGAMWHAAQRSSISLCEPFS